MYSEKDSMAEEPSMLIDGPIPESVSEEMSVGPRHRSVTHICACAGGKISYGKYESARLRVTTWESPRGE